MLELLITLAIIAVMVAFSYQNDGLFSGRNTLQNSMNQIAQQMQYARHTASTSAITTRVNVAASATDNKITVSLFQEGGTPPPSTCDATNVNDVLRASVEIDIPSGYVLTFPNDLCFYRNGTSNGAANTLTLAPDPGPPAPPADAISKSITVSIASGYIQIQ